MSDTDLQRGPTHFKDVEGAWWYEEPKGISIIVENRDEDGILRETKVLWLTWHKIRNALERKDRKP